MSSSVVSPKTTTSSGNPTPPQSYLSILMKDAAKNGEKKAEEKRLRQKNARQIERAFLETSLNSFPSAEKVTNLYLYRICKAFAEDKSLQDYKFPPSLSSTQRRAVHHFAEQFKVEHSSMGRRNRYIRLWKLSPQEKKYRDEQLKLFEKVEREYQQELAEKPILRSPKVQKTSSSSTAATSSSPAAMVNDSRTESSQRNLVYRLTKKWQKEVLHADTHRNGGGLRHVNFNIEWMDYLFLSDEAFKYVDEKSDVDDVDALCKMIAATIVKLDPDSLAIQEGPSTRARMELFVKKYLNDSYQTFGGLDGDQQRLFILIKKEGSLFDAQPFKEMNDYLAQEWSFDVKGDLSLELYHFTRTPFAIKASFKYNGEILPVFIVTLHTKSKFISAGRRLWNSKDPAVKEKFVRKAVKNRRRIAAECARTKKCIDKIIFQQFQNPVLIVSGDLNDGPSVDFFEQYFLLFDSVTALLGSPFSSHRMLVPLLTKERFVQLEDQWTAEFDDYVDGIKGKRVMLDHIFLSDYAYANTLSAGIAHSTFNKFATGRKRSQRPSDHRPVYVDLF